jgi:DNA-directed RNA polymerase subunit RPC12/RpoP
MDTFARVCIMSRQILRSKNPKDGAVQLTLKKKENKMENKNPNVEAAEAIYTCKKCNKKFGTIGTFISMATSLPGECPHCGAREWDTDLPEPPRSPEEDWDWELEYRLEEEKIDRKLAEWEKEKAARRLEQFENSKKQRILREINANL